MPVLYPAEPSITLYDPLAALLGAGDGRFTYRFDDAVRLAGHGCPTVAGAFLLVKRAIEILYADGVVAERGGLGVRLPGPVEAGVNGPMSQIFTLLTGAAPESGFQGLGGRHARKGLLTFAPAGAGPDPSGFRFTRLSTGQETTLAYDPSPIPPPPGMAEAMAAALAPEADPAVRRRFADLWRQRVVAILADGGAATISAA